MVIRLVNEMKSFSCTCHSRARVICAGNAERWHLDRRVTLSPMPASDAHVNVAPTTRQPFLHVRMCNLTHVLMDSNEDVLYGCIRQ